MIGGASGGGRPPRPRLPVGPFLSHRKCLAAFFVGLWVRSVVHPRAVRDDEAIEFTKAMEGIDTIPGPSTG